MEEVRSLAHQFTRSQNPAILKAHSADVQRIADAWVRAFAAIEGGQKVTPDALANIVLCETVQAVITHAKAPLETFVQGHW